ncbi:MAG: hypothetical protein HYR72_01740 [Deltaproteobacteria bacterium]|nr:hypothetical protein [Deltaproteobacteria bacterium]MBI3390777.1 hypothetical protein [Deltaproteobacteria bacterium]
MSRFLVRAALALNVLILGGCSAIFKPSEPMISPPVKLFAVLPLKRVDVSLEPQAVGVEVEQAAAPDAERVVTAQIYAVMAESSTWRFVPDLQVEQAMRDVHAAELEARALQLGKVVKADGVFYGTVSRFRERDGSEYGARHGASVSFRLALVSVETGATVWEGRFDQTQQALSSNLLDWWMFWEAGPKWVSARELSHLGVEQLLGQLRVRLP